MLERKKIIKRSTAQERRTAQRHGGRTTAGSGNQWNAKGDVRARRTLIENKRTDAKQITLKQIDLEKIWAEAWAEGRYPLLQFDLGGRAWVVMPEDDYLEKESNSDGLLGQTGMDSGREVSGE